MLLKFLKQAHRDLQARIALNIRTNEIVKTFQLSHAEELHNTPINQWGLVKQRHVQEIRAVREGKFDIVDRRTWGYPYLPEALHRLNQPILKNTPYNLRRFSETPIPRRAINLIKNGITSLTWQVEAVPDMEDEGNKAERDKRIRIATESLKRPNNVDSFRTFSESVIEDIIIGGYGCIEPRMTPYYKRPFKMWSVDGSTIRLYADWTESTPEKPRFAQMTGLKGERGVAAFLADELIYIKDNTRTNTPFGLGKLEVAFNTVNSFLGAQDMAGKAGSDQIHKTWLWWEQPQNPDHIQTVRRHVQNELEGQAKLSLIAGLKKPEVIDVNPVKPEDLLLEWQEFLIRIIANAFDISPFSLGLEKDVNRNTGLIMALSDFRGAVVPMARNFQETVTRSLLHGFMDWKDLQFTYNNLDDPDPLTKIQIQQRMYMMNAITPDEVREDAGLPALADGWGKLNQLQSQILITEAQTLAKQMGAGGSAGGGTGGGGSYGSEAGANGMPGAGSGGGPTASLNPAGSGGLRGGVFSAGEVAQMTPEDIEYFQSFGILPPTSELADQMDSQQPGILETLNENLKQFFEQQEEDRADEKEKPQKVSKKDEKAQMVKFKQSLRTPTVVEQYLNDRYRLGKGQQSAPGLRNVGINRGKYPRSGGDRGEYQ